jgi:hypothetical protein
VKKGVFSMKNIVILLGLVVSVAVLAGCAANTCPKPMEPVHHHDYKGEVAR